MSSLDPKRHLKFFDSSKEVPTTVILVPPALGPKEGDTESTVGERLYVYMGPLLEKSTPFMETSSATAPEEAVNGASHSI